jgi:hypothetical protein
MTVSSPPRKQERGSDPTRNPAPPYLLLYHVSFYHTAGTPFPAGHSICGEIHQLKFGRTYRLYDPEDQKAFHEAGGHGDDGCPKVCAAAARITADILLRLRGNA